MKGILFTGGDAPEEYGAVREYIEDADILCAADSGIYHAKRYGLSPDFIVGDMDSLVSADDIMWFDKAEVVKYSREKDFTDTELGFALLKKKGCDRIVIVGGGGGRTDHFIGIFSMFYRDIHPDCWIMRKEIIFSVDSRITLAAEIGDIISIFPVSSGVSEMISSGLKWSLDSLSWKIGDGGISNTAVSEKVTVEMKSGRLIICRDL